MWVAKFKFKDDEDVYSPLCVKYKIDFFADPNTNFIKDRKINLIVSGIISGSETNKKTFVESLKKDSRVKEIQQHHDFLFIRAVHSASREARAEIKIFYNPQYIRIKPVHVASNGWEYWEVACLDRGELNKLVRAAIKHYHGVLTSIKEEKIKSVAGFELTPALSEKQLEAISFAYKEGYYTYPRSLTIPALAKMKNKAYATFQEHMRKAENKLINYFLKYR